MRTNSTFHCITRQLSGVCEKQNGATFIMNLILSPPISLRLYILDWTLDPSNSSNLDQLVLKGLMLFNDSKTIILTQFYH